jgi:Family of unknown function (DUF1790).
MSKPLRQITNYLNQKGYKPEFDADSHTLFLDTDTPDGLIQTRYYFDLDMEVLSCQCIYTEEMPQERYRELCELANRFNEEIGFGAFLILEERDLVFEINYLMERDQILSESMLDKLSFVPSEALSENLPAFLLVCH